MKNCSRSVVPIDSKQNILINIRRRTYNKITESQTSFSVHFLLSFVTKQGQGRIDACWEFASLLQSLHSTLFNPQFSL